ncbi:MAG: exo-alpha-sialidase [Candidatus Dormibacteraeota bacterium]|nr:exo-alpha-sialidase [Candidatus Dormibacteraeota bacterium]
MGKPDDFDPRLKSYLHRGADTPPPAGLEARIITGRRRRRSGWLLQVAAAAALLVLAIGLGIAVQRARQSVGVTPTATPFASPNINPTPTPSGAPYPLGAPVNMRMINASTGWAAGSGTNRILRTADGGSHWDDVTPTGVPPSNWTTFFLDATNAWVASSLQPGSGSPDFSVHVYRTTDGGHSWHDAGVIAADQGWPAAMNFVDRNHGWLFMNLGFATGSQGVAFYGTVDGGMTWAKLSEADTSGTAGHLPVSCSKFPPVFLNSTTGWLPGACSAGGGPFFYVTRDGGRTWHNVALASPAGWGASCMCELTSLRFSDGRSGVFVLTDYSSSAMPESVIYSTSDGGSSWRPGPSLPAQTYEVFFLDKSRGWTLNAKSNGLMATLDGGQHWSTVGLIPTNSNNGVMGFQFMTPQVGWVLGGDSRGVPILKTVDGGATWTTQLSP